MTEHKYILEPYKGLNSRYRCPSCQQTDKTFSLYIDTDTGEHIHPSVGRCNREINCGHHYTPKQYFRDNNIPFDAKPKAVTHQPKPEPVFTVSHSVGSPIDRNEPLFTEIRVYDPSAKGVIRHLTLTDLQRRLNSFKNHAARKDTNPAILKGIYANGTAGENCTMPVPFLFFDIDVKEHENLELLDPARNKAVFELLKDIALLVWRSNSQKGIAGILSVPQFDQFKNETRSDHLKLSKLIYEYLSDYIHAKVGYKVHFDPQQGKFRQIRYLAEQTGRRVLNESSYSFHVTKSERQYIPRPVKQHPKPVSFIPVQALKNSLNGRESNHFVTFLINRFGIDVANELIRRYFIGSSKHWDGATVLWQIDTQGKVRTGKIMLYSPATGKRVTEPYNHINWVHKTLRQPEFELRQCLFGEHLLRDKSKPLALVESEKSAIIASLYLPQFSWLALGGVGFNIEKCSILRGRQVILFPDLSKPIAGKPTAFEIWRRKAAQLSTLANFSVSDLLERKATEAEREQGLDLADYLVKLDHKAFALPVPTEPPLAVQPVVVRLVVPVERFTPPAPPQADQQSVKPEQPKPGSWDQAINDLENYFAAITLPTHPVQLNKGCTIADCSQFIESHLATVKRHKGKRAFLPFIHQLHELKKVFMEMQLRQTGKVDCKTRLQVCKTSLQTSFEWGTP